MIINKEEEPSKPIVYQQETKYEGKNELAYLALQCSESAPFFFFFFFYSSL